MLEEETFNFFVLIKYLAICDLKEDLNESFNKNCAYIVLFVFVFNCGPSNLRITGD